MPKCQSNPTTLQPCNLATLFAVVLTALAVGPLPSLLYGQLPAGVVDTQPGDETPPSPRAALAKIKVPDGFRVTLFAGEPDVHQPIAMAFDSRGRLWVAECYSYPDWKHRGQDRILIFEDDDNDGTFDRRTVFASGLSNITGLALGFGGVWACSTPNFIFIPDADHDDRPDGLPQIKLNGWNDESREIEHNVFNGMTWGPDGWMYGAHGILADSLVGKPGTPDEQRVRLNCAIWRYHPVSEQFEVVAHGTTNSWGIDFDEYGQGFFTNCVIGHLWHLIPGARYQRMYGTHFNPYTYALIDACSDHLHWGGGNWTESRGGKGKHSVAGGGHAHVGAMIYLGGTWPREYRGSLFTCNLHGNRINRDRLHRRGSGYVASHAPDFLHAGDPWFRGLAAKYGPDGNVFVSDWTDLGECHDNDGTHRSSGRIYKIIYDGETPDPSRRLPNSPHRELLDSVSRLTLDNENFKSEPGPPRDLNALTDRELIGLQAHANAWYRRHARRVLHQRAAAGQPMDETREALHNLWQHARAKTHRLNILWTRGLVDGVDEQFAMALLDDVDEHVRCWAIQHLADSGDLSIDARQRMVKVVYDGPEKMVQLKLASVMQRIPPEDRWDLAEALIQRVDDNDDPNLSQMVWYGIEPLADVDAARFLRLAADSKLSLVTQLIARRAVSTSATNPRPRELLVEAIDQAGRAATKIALLAGMRDGLEGQRQVQMPRNWPGTYRRLQVSEDAAIRQLSIELAVKFSDQTAIDSLVQLAQDSTAKPQLRNHAVRLLAASQVDRIESLCFALLDDPTVRRVAIQSLAQFNDPQVPRRLLAAFPGFDTDQQEQVVWTLVSRTAHAIALLDAVEAGQVPVSAIHPAHAMQLMQLDDARIRRRMRELWGDVRTTPREKQQKIADWKAVLTPTALRQANMHNGRILYEQTCGKCHRLFGEGGTIGPDITGSDRRNLDYILHNVIDPSAVVGKAYRLQSIVLQDGRVISGALQEQTAVSVVVQTVEKTITIPRGEIQEIRPTRRSLMPEGQLETLSTEGVRDLIAYLASDPDP